MSLINDVLRDLDARRQGPGGDALAGLEVPRRAEPVARRRRGLALAAATALALLCAAAGILELGRQRAAGRPAASSTAQAAAPAAAAGPLAAAPPEAAFAETAGPAAGAPAARLPEQPAPAAAPSAPTQPRTVPAPPGLPPVASAPPPAASLALPTRAADPAPAPRRPSTTEQAHRHYRDALREAARGETDRARAGLSEALVLDPRHAAARSALATLLAREGDPAAALALLAEGRAEAPGELGFALLEARIRVEGGDLTGAIALLETTPAREAPERNGLLATLYQRSGRNAEAARLFQQALGADPRRGRWWLGLALAEESQGRTDRALAAYRAARHAEELDPAARNWVEQRLDALAGDERRD